MKWKIILLIIILGIFTFSVIKIPNQIAGKVYFAPVRAYGEVQPGIPDGTKIEFKTGYVELLTTYLKDNKYGYEERVFLKMDNPNTPEKEGFVRGDIVEAFIGGDKVAEYSYIPTSEFEKTITIPRALREKLSAGPQTEICESQWECGEWNECTAGKQTRNCEDKNNCESTRKEEKSCVEPHKAQPTLLEEKELGFDMTFIYLGMALVVIIILVSTLGRKKEDSVEHIEKIKKSVEKKILKPKKKVTKKKPVKKKVNKKKLTKKKSVKKAKRAKYTKKRVYEEV